MMDTIICVFYFHLDNLTLAQREIPYVIALIINILYMKIIYLDRNCFAEHLSLSCKFIAKNDMRICIFALYIVYIVYILTM